MRRKDTTPSLGLALLLFYGLVASVQAKYIFTEEPLARFSPSLGDQDLFGYAAALHLVDDTGGNQDFDHAIRNTKIIVGAPNGTFPGGVNVNRLEPEEGGPLNNTGLVYVCPISPPGDCEALTGNGTGNDIRLFDYQGDDADVFGEVLESKDGQFMGATIISSGEHLLICAPRWVSFEARGSRNFDQTRGHGRCYLSGREPKDFDHLRPCFGGTPSSEGGESYCMAGTSASLHETNTTAFSAYLGGPPYLSSNGAVFGYDVADGDTISERETTRFTHVTDFVYGGFSVSLGRITSSDGIDLVSSLPKQYNYKGAVRVIDVSDRGVEDELLGRQMGEYFGWALATADLNGDGFDEIIVGAPLFSTPDRIEKGRIFIYKNNGTLDTYNPIIIPGNGAKGRYGSAIVNLGDINSDGFEDIAVGAPFEVHEGGAEGTVYVYLGSGETVINTTPEDTITARAISERLGLEGSRVLKTFGYSLSSGADVDANWNNDLVIGGYKPQAVIVLRTQSIANISLSLSTIPDTPFNYTDPGCPLSFGRFSCFELVINASFSGRGLKGRSLETRVEVRENPVSAGSRLFFLDSDGNKTEVFEGFLNFDTTDTLIQKNVTVYVENDIQDRRSPLRMVVTVLERERERREMINGSEELIDLREFPLLNIMPQNDLEQKLTLAGCRNPVMCMPDLELTLNRTRYLRGSEIRDEADPMNVVVLASRESTNHIEVTLNYRTLNDDATNTVVKIDLNTAVFGSPVVGNGTCDLMSGNTFSCPVEPIFSSSDSNLTVTITIPLLPTLVGSEDDATISFFITPGEDMDTEQGNNAVTVTVDITARNRVTISDVTVTPAVVQPDENVGDIGMEEVLTRVFLVGSGPTTIPQSTLTIFIPGKIEETGELYYLYPVRSAFTVEDPSGGSASVTCSNLNPENLEQFRRPQKRRRRRQTSSPGIMRRLWRELMEGQVEEPQKMGKRQEEEDVIALVDCFEDREACIPITCTITNFGTDMTITLTSVADNRFFKNQRDDSKFFMRAEYMKNSMFFEQSSAAPEKSDLLTVRGIPRVMERPIPIWVYVVSILIAIIIIALIIIALFLLVICLRRRTKKKIRRATERRRSRHGTITASTGGGAVVTSLDTKPSEAEVDEKPKPPQGGEDTPDKPTAPPPPEADEPAEDDPDETEL